MNTSKNGPLVVIANREPYSHSYTADGVEIQRPASGLVTALEPVLRKRGGFWIAHGSGTADVEFSDEHGELEVPPENPAYRLKRVWLSPAEQRSYYDGFSNEALWPLFHLAHQRPTFREGDWNAYLKVNARFAEAIADTVLAQNPLILVQDYHLALVPRMLRERAARLNLPLKIALVWHIPWVPSEVFAICPWAEKLLEGMLGADIISFHTAAHRNNFLQTCDRLLESRINHEDHSVIFRGKKTQIKANPIGIDPPQFPSFSKQDIRMSLRRKYDIEPRFLGLGVDRLDYTKGIPERFRAIEAFLDSNPNYIGDFTFLQISSPSRTEIPSYQAFTEEVLRTAQEINRKFEEKLSKRMESGSQASLHAPNGSENPAIRLVQNHHSWSELAPLYRAADFCLVSSLHDGMNLVAKEYIWSQDGEAGSLILSRFTGASQELRDSILVNPYSVEEMARAIKYGIELPAEEKMARMARMRDQVVSRTAQDWANEMIDCLAH